MHNLNERLARLEAKLSAADPLREMWQDIRSHPDYREGMSGAEAFALITPPGSTPLNAIGMPEKEHHRPAGVEHGARPGQPLPPGEPHGR